MAVHTTFFLCTSEELVAGFPTWKPPLKEPVLRQFKNPATGGFVTLPSIAPEWPEYAEVSIEQLAERVASKSSEEGFSEARLPVVVRERPRWSAAGLGTLELTVLSDLLGAPSTFECALCAPPSLSEQLVEFPEPLFSKLKSLDQSLGLADLREIAGRWADKLLPPEDWEPVEGEPIEAPWSCAFALSILEPIVGLAKLATGEEQMYLLMQS